MQTNSLFALLSARQRWLGARFNILAQNVANADTPGYAPRDLDKTSFERLLSRRLAGTAPEALRRTDPRHLGAAPPRITAEARVVRSEDVAPNGNAVVLAEEVQKLAATERDYALATSLFRKFRAMFETAVASPR